jgi:hypothetical protein
LVLSENSAPAVSAAIVHVTRFGGNRRRFRRAQPHLAPQQLASFHPRKPRRSHRRLHSPVLWDSVRLITLRPAKWGIQSTGHLVRYRHRAALPMAYLAGAC